MHIPAVFSSAEPLARITTAVGDHLVTLERSGPV